MQWFWSLGISSTVWCDFFKRYRREQEEYNNGVKYGCIPAELEARKHKVDYSEKTLISLYEDYKAGGGTQDYISAIRQLENYVTTYGIEYELNTTKKRKRRKQ